MDINFEKREVHLNPGEIAVMGLGSPLQLTTENLLAAINKLDQTKKRIDELAGAGYVPTVARQHRSELQSWQSKQQAFVNSFRFAFDAVNGIDAIPETKQ